MIVLLGFPVVEDTRTQLVNFIILTSNVLGPTSRRNYHCSNDCILSVSRPGSTLNYRACISEGQFSVLIRVTWQMWNYRVWLMGQQRDAEL